MIQSASLADFSGFFLASPAAANAKISSACFDPGRFKAFANLLHTHYESGASDPKLKLSGHKEPLDIISITIEKSTATAAQLLITHKNGETRLKLSEENHQLVELRRDDSEKIELALGWEDKGNKSHFGFIYFEKNTVA